ncbi:MAG: vWA domain-containing protein [Polyangiaceae bacterium]
MNTGGQGGGQGGSNGQPCDDANACPSGNCVDGVCCDTACDGECESCLAASTGATDGTCAAVTALTDPDMECVDPLELCDGMSMCSSCVDEQATIERTPLDIFVLLDRSGSMNGTKWNTIQQGLGAFFTDMGSAGTSAALTFFPKNGITVNTCDPMHYDPPHTMLQALPQGSAPLVMALNDESPGGGTPAYGALQGTLAFATAHQTANPGRKVIVVLGTDGLPNGCPGNQNETTEIALLAQGAFKFNGVQTFTIAIQGASVNALNQIAAAGGTGQVYDVTGNTSLFLSKMQELRAAAQSCDYPAPTLPGNVAIVSSKVNVEYAPGNMLPAVLIPQASGAGDCGAGDGYYFNDPNTPTAMTFCFKTCSTLQADPGASLELKQGCPAVSN